MALFFELSQPTLDTKMAHLRSVFRQKRNSAKKQFKMARNSLYIPIFGILLQLPQ